MIRPNPGARSQRRNSVGQKALLGVLHFMWVVACLATSVDAAVLTVTNNTDGIAPPPAGSLRQAIATAANDDIIQFAPDVTGTITLVGAEFLLDKNISIIGPGASALAISGNNQSRIFQVPAGATVSIVGLTLRNGKAPDGSSAPSSAPAPPGGSGGAIESAGTVYLTDCTLTDNRAGNGGSKVALPENSGAGGDGGAISNIGTLVLRRCALTENAAGQGGYWEARNSYYSAVAGRGGNGGAIYSPSGSLHLTDCSVRSNVAGSGGHGFGNFYNSSTSDGGQGGNGGAISAAGPIIIERSCISENSAGAAGGGTAAGGAGGGVSIEGVDAIVRASTLSGNRAGPGVARAGGAGGGIAASGTVMIISCTIVKNASGVPGTITGSTAGTGGGVSSTGNTVLRNSIVAANTTGPTTTAALGPDVHGAFSSGGHNLIGRPDGSTGFTAGANADLVGTGAAPLDPQLSPLAQNGGLTASHALLEASPALDAGDDTLSGFDQRGFPRLLAAHVDIGAFESAFSAPPILFFGLPASQIREGAGYIALTVTRAGDTQSPVSVQYATSPASAGSDDYTTANGTIQFAAGETQAIITVSIKDDDLLEPIESFEVALSAPTANALFGAGDKHTVTILDDEIPAVISFASDAAEVQENAGSVQVRVLRSGYLQGTASAPYSTRTGTATGAGDYIDTSGTVTFAPGVTEQFITIPITDDTSFEGRERFSIKLDTPMVNAHRGTTSTHLLTILDNESPAGDVWTVTNLSDDPVAPVPGSLRHAVQNVAPAQSIQFATGLTGSIILAGIEIVLDRDITIIGPGASILAISGNQQSRVFRIPSGVTLTVSGLTIREGKAANGMDMEIGDASPGDSGGAILNAGSLRLFDCVLTSNKAGNGGKRPGTLYEGGTGGTGGSGGAIFSVGASVILTRCKLEANRAGDGGEHAIGGHGGDGGAVSCKVGRLEMVECTVAGNVAGTGAPEGYSAFSARGGGSGGRGGGIEVLVPFSLVKSCVSGNQAGKGGGGWRRAAPGGSGGGVYVNSTDARLDTSTISNNASGDTPSGTSPNSAGFGAGIYAKGTVTIVSCTIFNNLLGSAGPDSNRAEGGGIFSVQSIVTLQNTIVAGNRHPLSSGAAPDVSGPFVTAGHNLIGRSDGSTGFTAGLNSDLVGSASPPLNPSLGSLAENGGPTPTHLLLQNSPAIDAGDDSISGTDQLGLPRLVGTHVDIGAVESRYSGVPLVSFAASAAQVQESAGTVTILVTRAIDTAPAVSAQFSTTSGTATAGADFTGMSGAVNFASGQTEATIVIPILNDSVLESGETFQITLTSNGSSNIGLATHTVTILDDEISPKIEFAVAASSIGEGGGILLVTVLRKDNSDASASVAYATANGSATSGSDFAPVSGNLSFGPGVTQRTIAVQILNDSAPEQDETFSLQLSSPSAGATLGVPAVHVVTIQNDDVPPILSFEVAASTVSESAGNALVRVRRSGLLSGSVSVAYESAAGTAQIHTDFTPAAGSITFTDSVTEHTIVIPIVNDNLTEAAETFVLTLSAPTNGAVIQGNATHTITILSDDEPPAVAFAAPDSAVGEAASSAALTIVRRGDPSVAFSVTLTTSDGTANAGDFVASTQTISFAAGVTSLTVQFPILNDVNIEEAETFFVTLNQPTNGASLAAPSTHTVTILDDDETGAIGKGSYRGLAERADEPEIGGLSVDVTGNRHVTGTLHLGGKPLRLRGRFSEEGAFSQTFAASRTDAFAGTLELRISEEGAALNGTFARLDGAAFNVNARRNKGGTRANPVEEANPYTALIQTELSGLPAGFLRIAVLPAGHISLLGMLPDGTRLRSSSHIAEDGTFACFVPCHARLRGYLAGRAQVALGNSLPLSGSLAWQKPASTSEPYATGLDHHAVALLGAVYAREPGSRILNDFNPTGAGRLRLNEGSSVGGLDVPFSWKQTNGVAVASPNPVQARIVFQSRSGTFSGRFRDESGRFRRFYGICVQHPDSGEDIAAGFSVGSTKAVRVELRPVE